MLLFNLGFFATLSGVFFTVISMCYKIQNRSEKVPFTLRFWGRKICPFALPHHPRHRFAVPLPTGRALGAESLPNRQNAKAFCHPERSRKSDAIADDADLGLAKTNLLARMRQGIKYAWIHARETLAFDCVRLLMWGCHNVISLRSG